MAPSTSSGGALSAQAVAVLDEGIALVFGRWMALQMAVENQWRSRDSRAKADQLAESILSWFTNSNGEHYYEDLVDMMYDTVSESFNADFEDGSVEEVAEELLIMHEECLQSNYSSVEKLRNSRAQRNAVSQSRKMVVDGDDDSSDDDEESSMVDNEAGGVEKRWRTSQNLPSLPLTLMAGLWCHLGVVGARIKAQKQNLGTRLATCKDRLISVSNFLDLCCAFSIMS